ncbi:hypothetical protein [Fusobacterium sp.]|uniref:hypothetical protein n=2 Tax=Fusobacterium sp. TaxID=68766 RepID=UPI0026026E20|nr:hypothetical protein [Fusobacterium sp.]
MRDRIRLAVAFVVVSYIVFGIKLEEIPAVSNLSSSATQIELKKEREGAILAGTDEVEIDLLNNTLKAKNGINLKQGDLELKAYDIRRDIEKNRAYVNGELQTLFSNEVGDLSLQSLEGGNVSLAGTDGEFYKNFGYLDVSKVTGAEAPNNNIYFGGDKIQYKDNKIFINDGWLTTDFNIMKTKDPNDAGYHFLSENIIIEPDKQITLKNSDFFLGDKSRLPFRFPWYRANIRQGSQVPLFPQWGTDDYYGWNVSWGFLYGDRGDKYIGGFAPKFADTMGVLVGRWENWYKTDNFGTMKLNVDDWLVHSKEKSLDTSKLDPMKDAGKYLEHEEKKKRYRVNYTHEYDAEYGKLYFNTINATYNMIPRLEDIVVDYTNNNRFGAKEEEGVRPDLTKTMSFFSMDADLKNLGADKDITLKSKLKLTDDKKAYALMVYDDIDDVSYGSSIDNDLFSQVELYKDNKSYKIGGYYNYLYDMDPGSTFDDTQSRAEDFGFEYLDKETKVGFSYDEKNGDRFRKLGLWERDPKLDSLLKYNSMYGSKFKADYSPSMVKEYNEFDTKDLRVSFGEYDFTGDYKIKPGYDYYSEIRELNLDNDPLREKVIKGNERSKQYNRFEDIIYSNFEQKRGYVDIFNDTTKFTFAGGKTEEEFWDRTGIYTADGYRKYINNSDFYEVSAQRDEISLDNFGEIALFGGLRYDKYTSGYNPYSNNGKGNFASGEDSTLRTQLKLNHTMTVFNNEENIDRTIDLSMANNLTLFYQRYDYDSGSVNFGEDTNGRSAEYIRLKNKDNIYQVKDSINTTVGNTETIYTIDYKRAENPATNKLNNEVVKNDLEFKIDGDKSLVLNYGEDKKYTDETLNKENYNYYTFRDYGVTYYLGDHRLSYQNNSIDSRIWDIDPKYNNGLNIDNAKEKIRLNTYSYEYTFGDNRLGLDFSEGRDNRRNYKTLEEELDVKNQIYGVSFLDGGDVENYYRATYEIYNHNEKGARDLTLDGRNYNSQNSDIISFNYEYRDKRFSDDELRRYAEIEFDKDSNSLTPQEIYRVRDILRNRERNHVDFKLNRSIYDDFTNMAEYKRNFRVNLMLQRNEARYKMTEDYWDSLEEIQAGVFYSQNRFGIGYEVDENADWRNKKWGKVDREHKISLVTKIGKPSEGWTLKTYAKFYEDLTGEIKQSSDERARKSSLDGLGIEIGKEMGYYQWSVAFEKEYVLSARDYEWRAALQFTLLTFPSNPIFGIGADTGVDKKTKPETYMFDGLKVEDIVD